MKEHPSKFGAEIRTTDVSPVVVILSLRNPRVLVVYQANSPSAPRFALTQLNPEAFTVTVPSCVDLTTVERKCEVKWETAAQYILDDGNVRVLSLKVVPWAVQSNR